MTLAQINSLITQIETEATTPWQKAFARQWAELKEDNPKRAETASIREWYARRWKDRRS